MARKLGIDSRAVAYAVVEELLTEDETRVAWDNQDAVGIAHHLLEAADVEYQPRARKLILTFDLSGEPGSLDVPDPTPGPYDGREINPVGANHISTHE